MCFVWAARLKNWMLPCRLRKVPWFSVQGNQLDEVWSNYYVEISATFWFNVLSHEKKRKKKTQMGKLIFFFLNITWHCNFVFINNYYCKSKTKASAKTKIRFYFHFFNNYTGEIRNQSDKNNRLPDYCKQIWQLINS